MPLTPSLAFLSCPAHALPRKALTLALAGAIGTLMAGTAGAEDLLSLYQASRVHDATFLAAQAQAQAAQYKADQAKALLLPTVGLQASVNRNRYKSDLPDNPVTGSTGGYATVKSAGVSARQPLYNKANWAQVEQADQSLAAAEADLQMAEQDLMVRLTQAYFDVLAAQDVLQTTVANKTALNEQLASAKRSFEVGNATITDTREAQARYDLSTAQELAATNDLQVKQLALAQLVGKNQVVPDPLSSPSKLDSLSPGAADNWVQQASSTAPLVRKAQAGLKAAELEVDRVKAGHLPTVDLVATAASTDVDSSVYALRSAGGDGTSASLGVELNMSLYNGGAIQNRVREALAMVEKARNDVDNATRTSSLNTRQAYLGVQSGLAQVKAYEAAESSAKLALEATQLGYRVGVRINKDVLDAQTQLLSTQKDLFKARYDVIVGSMRLRQASGLLTLQDIEQLNNALLTKDAAEPPAPATPVAPGPAQ